MRHRIKEPLRIGPEQGRAFSVEVRDALGHLFTAAARAAFHPNMGVVPSEAEPPQPIPQHSMVLLSTQVKPLLNVARQEEEMKAKEEELRNAMSKTQELMSRVKELEEKMATLSQEKNDLTIQLQAVCGPLEGSGGGDGSWGPWQLSGSPGSLRVRPRERGRAF